MMTIMEKEVKNMPTYAANKEFIVARPVEGELWFWGSWNDEVKDRNAALDIGGVVLRNAC